MTKRSWTFAPEFEDAPEGCDMQIRCPGMIGIAARPDRFSRTFSRTWFELSPIDGGRVLVGAARWGPTASLFASAHGLRETCWSMALAGVSPEMILECSVVGVGKYDVGVIYGIVDPFSRRADLAALGEGATAVVVERGRTRSLPLQLDGDVQSFSAVLEHGTALALVAHDAMRRELVLPAVDKVVASSDGLAGEEAARRLCSQLISGPLWRDGVATVLFFTDDGDVRASEAVSHV